MGFEGLRGERTLDFFRVFLEFKLVHENIICGRGIQKCFFASQIYIFAFQVPTMTHF